MRTNKDFAPVFLVFINQVSKQLASFEVVARVLLA
jgi:hypothetical protein